MTDPVVPSSPTARELVDMMARDIDTFLANLPTRALPCATTTRLEGDDGYRLKLTCKEPGVVTFVAKSGNRYALGLLVDYVQSRFSASVLPHSLHQLDGTISLGIPVNPQPSA